MPTNESACALRTLRLLAEHSFPSKSCIRYFPKICIFRRLAPHQGPGSSNKRLAVRAELVEAHSPFDRLRANELKRTALALDQLKCLSAWPLSGLTNNSNVLRRNGQSYLVAGDLNNILKTTLVGI